MKTTEPGAIECLDITLAPNRVRLDPRTRAVVWVPSGFCILSDARKFNSGLGNDRRSLTVGAGRAALTRNQAARLTAATPQRIEAIMYVQLICCYFRPIV
jgi:hypothetical protein